MQWSQLFQLDIAMDNLNQHGRCLAIVPEVCWCHGKVKSAQHAQHVVVHRVMAASMRDTRPWQSQNCKEFKVPEDCNPGTTVTNFMAFDD